MSPVPLRLLAGRRLESTHRRHLRRLSLRLQPVLQNRVAARIVAIPQFPQQHLRVPPPSLQSLVQIRLERLQLTCRRRSPPVSGNHGLQQILPDRFTVVASQLTDRLNAHPTSLELVDFVHVFPPEQVFALLWAPEKGLRSEERRVGKERRSRGEPA